ncbi:MAG: DNA-processing protein DprA [Candidatus Bipolaricaulota bacterium]|nr:MAG: DNA-processing protein DprA [Candidatus Bipolaricaulota bacterium]
MGAWYVSRRSAATRGTGASDRTAGEERERACLIGLHLVPAVTPHRLYRMLSTFGSASATWSAPAGSLVSVIGDWNAARVIVAGRDMSCVDHVQRSASREGIRILTILDGDYPQGLRPLALPPPVLYLRGDAEDLSPPAIAVVGTRRASGYGKAVARRLAGDLAEAGITVVSGLAAGVDAAAHGAAVAAGGRTVAVLGCGLLHRLPSWQRALAERIASHGALLSEFPLTMSPARWTFPQRNRVLSGISQAVVVVEAPARSGALITAEWALRQGKDVFAVPGNVTSRASAGCNALLRDGALVATSADDVLFAVGVRRIPRAAGRAKDVEELSGTERAVLDQIGLEAVHIDDIIARGGLSPAEAAHILLVLEMKDLISALDGKRFIRTP